MDLFKNGVGRPSNDTLRKRKIFIISVVAIVAVLAGIGVYFGVKFARGGMNSGTFNISGSSNISVTVTAYNLNNNKKLDSWKNKDVYMSNWRNYPVKFVVSATSKNADIYKITYSWNDGGHYTEKAAQSSMNSKKNTNKDETKGSSATISYKASGIRQGIVTVVDSQGRERKLTLRVAIDVTAPTISFDVKGTKQSNGSYPSGTVVQATCTDGTGQVVYMKTTDAQDTSDYVTYNSSAVSSKSQKITLVTTGSKRYITTTCKDKAGNSVTKSSNAISIGVATNNSSNNNSNNNSNKNNNSSSNNNSNSNYPNYGTKPMISIKATNAKGKVLKTSKNSANLDLQSLGWMSTDYIKYEVSAVSKSGQGIARIEYRWNNTGYKVADNFKIVSNSNNKSTYYNTGNISFKFTGQGARYATITVYDKNGQYDIVTVTGFIDRTKPTMTIGWGDGGRQPSSGSNIKLGTKVKITCTDNLTGIKEITAYERANPKHKVGYYNVKSGYSLQIAYGTVATKNQIVATCTDKAGNTITRNSTIFKTVAK